MHINLRNRRLLGARSGSKLLTLLLFGTAATFGCRREEVTHFRVPKEATEERPMARPASMESSGDVPATATPSQGDLLKWTLPKGWTQSLSGGIRYATLKPSGPGRVEVTVVVLPGPAGGEIANVNRWRGQIGLDPIDEASLASARKTVQSKAGAVSVYDFTSEGQSRSRVVAGLILTRGNSWFVKMSGDAAAVAAARPEFIRLLESLRLD